jgi:hypothetical protein
MVTRLLISRDETKTRVLLREGAGRLLTDTFASLLFHLLHAYREARDSPTRLHSSDLARHLVEIDHEGAESVRVLHEYAGDLVGGIFSILSSLTDVLEHFLEYESFVIRFLHSTAWLLGVADEVCGSMWVGKR